MPETLCVLATKAAAFNASAATYLEYKTLSFELILAHAMTVIAPVFLRTVALPQLILSLVPSNILPCGVHKALVTVQVCL